MELLQYICKFEKPKNKLWKDYEFIIDNKYKYKHEYYSSESFEYLEYSMPFSIIYITNMKTNKKYFYRFNDFTRDKEEYDFTEELFTPLYISKYIFGQLDKYKINIINYDESDDETDDESDKDKVKKVNIDKEVKIDIDISKNIDTNEEDEKEYIDGVDLDDIINYIEYTNLFTFEKDHIEDYFCKNTDEMSLDDTICLTIKPNIPGLKEINISLYNINTYIEFCKKLII
jgi:hypothetical protein